MLVLARTTHFGPNIGRYFCIVCVYSRPLPVSITNMHLFIRLMCDIANIMMTELWSLVDSKWWCMFSLISSNGLISIYAKGAFHSKKSNSNSENSNLFVCTFIYSALRVRKLLEVRREFLCSMSSRLLPTSMGSDLMLALPIQHYHRLWGRQFTNRM